MSAYLVMQREHDMLINSMDFKVKLLRAMENSKVDEPEDLPHILIYVQWLSIARNVGH